MKPKLISLSAITAVAIAASSICVIGTVRAQIESGIGSNPHLRAQSAGQTGSPGTTVSNAGIAPGGRSRMAGCSAQDTTVSR